MYIIDMHWYILMLTDMYWYLLILTDTYWYVLILTDVYCMVYIWNLIQIAHTELQVLLQTGPLIYTDIGTLAYHINNQYTDIY